MSNSSPSNEPDTRNGGQLLVAALGQHGIDTLFGVPGESVLPVFDALQEPGCGIRFVTCRHEASASQMAEADAKLRRGPSAFIVSRGPGAMHGAIGLHTAFQDGTPLLMIVGQVPRAHRGREAFQEMDFAKVFAPATKWAAEIPDAHAIPEYVRRALHIACSGRPGPVVLSVPEDVLDELSDAADASPQLATSPEPTASDVAALGKLLENAERPLLIVGGSGWTEAACADIAAFASASGLPVVAAFRSQDIVDNRRPEYVGDLSLGQNPALARRVADADLLLVVGDRLGDVPTRGYTSVEAPDPAQTLVHVFPEAGELGRVFRTDLPILSGPPAFAQAVAGLTLSGKARWADWRDDARREYLAFHTPAAASGKLDMAHVVAHLRQSLPDDAIVTNGAGNYNIWLHRHFAYRQPGTQIAPKAGTMGYGVPAAIAAKLRFPDRAVVALAGDGCFTMALPELATAMQNRLAIVVIIVNNAMYGSIRMHQERHFPGRPLGTALENPDFVALARSYGALAARVESTDAFPGALAEALDAGRLAVIELQVDPDRLSPDMSL